MTTPQPTLSQGRRRFAKNTAGVDVAGAVGAVRAVGAAESEHQYDEMIGASEGKHQHGGDPAPAAARPPRPPPHHTVRVVVPPTSSSVNVGEHILGQVGGQYGSVFMPVVRTVIRKVDLQHRAPETHRKVQKGVAWLLDVFSGIDIPGTEDGVDSNKRHLVFFVDVATKRGLATACAIVLCLAILWGLAVGMAVDQYMFEHPWMFWAPWCLLYTVLGSVVVMLRTALSHIHRGSKKAEELFDLAVFVVLFVTVHCFVGYLTVRT